jgi:hypothetical protein
MDIYGWTLMDEMGSMDEIRQSKPDGQTLDKGRADVG